MTTVHFFAGFQGEFAEFLIQYLTEEQEKAEQQQQQSLEGGGGEEKKAGGDSESELEGLKQELEATLGRENFQVDY